MYWLPLAEECSVLKIPKKNHKCLTYINYSHLLFEVSNFTIILFSCLVNHYMSIILII